MRMSTRMMKIEQNEKLRRMRRRRRRVADELSKGFRMQNSVSMPSWYHIFSVRTGHCLASA